MYEYEEEDDDDFVLEREPWFYNIYNDLDGWFDFIIQQKEY